MLIDKFSVTTNGKVFEQPSRDAEIVHATTATKMDEIWRILDRVRFVVCLQIHRYLNQYGSDVLSLFSAVFGNNLSIDALGAPLLNGNLKPHIVATFSGSRMSNKAIDFSMASIFSPQYEVVDLL